MTRSVSYNFCFSLLSLLGVAMPSMYLQYAVRICMCLAFAFLILGVVICVIWFLLPFYMLYLSFLSVYGYLLLSMDNHCQCELFCVAYFFLVFQKRSQMTSTLAFSFHFQVILACTFFRSFSIFCHLLSCTVVSLLVFGGSLLVFFWPRYMQCHDKIFLV